jgi:hypothetical protein
LPQQNFTQRYAIAFSTFTTTDMGIIIIFVVMVILLVTTLGTLLFYKCAHWLMIEWCRLPFSNHLLWTAICIIVEAVNLWYLLFFLNDARGSVPDTTIVWKVLIIFSLLVSTVTYFIGHRLIKI